MQVDFWCCTSYLKWLETCCKPLQASIFWIWLTRYFNFWQWTLLYCGCFYQCNECIPCQLYCILTPLPTIKWMCWKVCTNCESLFYKAKEEERDLFRCLMIYHNTPLSGSLQSLMQILHSRCTRSDLPMSNAARKQLCLQPEKWKNVYKNEHLPSHDLHIGQDVMYHDVTSKWWYPVTISSLCTQPRCYYITARDGVTYIKTQAHLKPCQPQCKKTEDEHSDRVM